MQLDLEIHNQLVRYVAQEISAEQFRDWFDVATWDVEQSGNRTAQELAGEIELRLAEFSSGHLTEEELRAKLRPLIGVFSSRHAASWVSTSSASITVSHHADLGSNVDIRVAKVCA